MAFNHELSKANHRITRWTFADSTARLAKTGLTSNDVDKVAKEVSTGTYWIVLSVSSGVPTWGQLSSSVGTELSSNKTDDVAGNSTSSTKYPSTKGVFDFVGAVATSIDADKQDVLVSGTNIKTINGVSLLGSSNISLQEPITLTTIGTSGAATFTSNVLNIPNYAGGGGGLTNFTEGVITAAPHATIPVNYLTPSSGASDADFALFAKGTGAIINSLYVDATSTLLDKRGISTIDLQTVRDSVTNVVKGAYSTLIGGGNNEIQTNIAASSGWYSIIAGGFNSKMTLSAGSVPDYSGMFSSRNCIMTASSTNSVMIGGNGNTMTNSVGCIMLGGGSSSLVDSDLLVTIGSGLSASRSGAFMQGGSGHLGVPGDSQFYQTLLKGITTNATVTQLTTAGNPAVNYNGFTMGIKPNGGIVWNGEVIAKQENSTNGAAWKIEGWAVLNAAGTTVTIKASTITAMAGNAAWTLATVIDNTNGSVKLNFTGAAGTNIKVVATVRVTEVTYN